MLLNLLQCLGLSPSLTPNVRSAKNPGSRGGTELCFSLEFLQFDYSDFLLLLNPNLVIYIFLENFPKERIQSL